MNVAKIFVPTSQSQHSCLLNNIRLPCSLQCPRMTQRRVYEPSCFYNALGPGRVIDNSRCFLRCNAFEITKVLLHISLIQSPSGRFFAGFANPNEPSLSVFVLPQSPSVYRGICAANLGFLCKLPCAISRGGSFLSYGTAACW